MRVKTTGQPHMSNAEVLRWLQAKRTQHTRENYQAPENLRNALERHERHLSSQPYPYTANPSVYSTKHSEQRLHQFASEHLKRIQQPLVLKYNRYVRDKGMSQATAQRRMKIEQDRKELSEAEMLMIYNLAPTCVEILQPCIEEVENRFSPEELEILVEIIKGVFRADETNAKLAADGLDVVDVQMGERAGAGVT